MQNELEICPAIYGSYDNGMSFSKETYCEDGASAKESLDEYRSHCNGIYTIKRLATWRHEQQDTPEIRARLIDYELESYTKNGNPVHKLSFIDANGEAFTASTTPNRLNNDVLSQKGNSLMTWSFNVLSSGKIRVRGCRL